MHLRLIVTCLSWAWFVIQLIWSTNILKSCYILIPFIRFDINCLKSGRESKLECRRWWISWDLKVGSNHMAISFNCMDFGPLRICSWCHRGIFVLLIYAILYCCFIFHIPLYLLPSPFNTPTPPPKKKKRYKRFVKTKALFLKIYLFIVSTCVPYLPPLASDRSLCSTVKHL